ncbi:anhydro-N-acetylmuramic acid kinase [Streptoalloteichus tenebrarius]|uniref:Anhydro-N-acetylmuramic acid kinase n=1 Tax=Streptoalloteichus tenebrarius (strain ATCC 17920 / DSM 40477 / JCM 4838 / CBS 697.72 / NBRC 16177 / NCIMB 11028 / NRRL B-12390 / A12253. 1 / ISP 5477) TaxID=1933 RepID=A0ABT1HZD5_STRSD|nr:anhydro-N-acetylmuramic acid kinase [Streptoalloteichus tenebrarius]BFF03356.1 anhydro-N-acetylmuramic acid kinase [Streptoalloteichus tenebrarius]
MLGLLSGTSVDAIDVAAAEFHLVGDVLDLTPLGALTVPHPGGLREEVLAALPPGPCSARRLCELDTRLGLAFAEAAARGLAELADGRADLVASLGQTVYHWVEDGRCLGTLQLGQAAWIAEATGLPVVADLRARDVAAGGQGAPLVALLDDLWLRDHAPAVAVNLGGIANITVVRPEEETLAYDTGPANALLDAACRWLSGGSATRDTDGVMAAAGSVRADLLDRLLADPYYALPPPKSTGKERFHLDHVHAALAGLPPVRDVDLLATLTELTAVTVADACHRHGARLVVASGGGVRNPVLLRALRRRLAGVDLRVSDALGLPADAKEAYLAAMLGFLTWHGLPGNLPSATGADGPRVLGSITPGRRTPRQPSPATHAPRRLRLTPPTGR